MNMSIQSSVIRSVSLGASAQISVTPVDSSLAVSVDIFASHLSEELKREIAFELHRYIFDVLSGKSVSLPRDWRIAHET